MRSILLSSLFILVTNLVLGNVLMFQARNVTKTLLNSWMLDIVKSAASTLDGDVLE